MKYLSFYLLLSVVSLKLINSCFLLNVLKIGVCIIHGAQYTQVNTVLHYLCNSLLTENKVLSSYQHTGEKPLYFLCLGFIGYVWCIVWSFVSALVYRYTRTEPKMLQTIQQLWKYRLFGVFWCKTKDCIH